MAQHTKDGGKAAHAIDAKQQAKPGPTLEQTIRVVELVPSVFEGDGKPGDFKLAIDDGDEETLYLTWENLNDKHSPTPGGGSAVLRLHTFRHPNVPPHVQPRAVAIPTGWTRRRAFCSIDDDDQLTELTKHAIECGFKEAHYVLNKYPKIRRVVFPADADDKSMIGVGLFKTSMPASVRRFISSYLPLLRNPNPKATLPSQRCETILNQVAKREERHAKAREHFHSIEHYRKLHAHYGPDEIAHATKHAGRSASSSSVTPWQNAPPHTSLNFPRANPPQANQSKQPQQRARGGYSGIGRTFYP